MGKKPLWENQSPDQMVNFAKEWLFELENPGESEEYGRAVVWMGFTAPLDQQMEFLRASLACAETDSQLLHIAAGPAEQTLSKFGVECIEECERWAKSDSRFARMLTGVFQHLMSDEVWGRVQSIQAGVSDPLVIEDGPA